MKKLERSRSNRMIMGVLGGLGTYFNLDATLLRVVFVFTVLITGFFPGVVAYIVAIFIMPEEGSPIIHTVHAEAKE